MSAGRIVQGKGDNMKGPAASQLLCNFAGWDMRDGKVGYKEIRRA